MERFSFTYRYGAPRGRHIKQPDGLAHRLKCGDRDALAALFSQHWERLWRMVNFRMDRRLLGRVDADDVLQEAYLAAADRLQHYRDDSSRVALCLAAVDRPANADRRPPAPPRRADARPRPRGRPARLPLSRSTTAALAAQLVGNVTSPSQAAVRAETLEQVEQVIAGHGPAGPRGPGAAAFRGIGQ